VLVSSTLRDSWFFIPRACTVPGQLPGSAGCRLRSFVQAPCANGVPREAIRLEEGSHNTWENFHNSGLIVEAMSGRVGILTSDDHSGRVAAVCRKLGWSPVLVPVPDAHKRWNVWEQRWPLLWDLSVETAKRCGY
jgi:DUF218 domain